MTARREPGFVLIPLLVSVLLGAVLAAVAAFSLVASLSTTPDPVTKPLVTYDNS